MNNIDHMINELLDILEPEERVEALIYEIVDKSYWDGYAEGCKDSSNASPAAVRQYSQRYADSDH